MTTNNPLAKLDSLTWKHYNLKAIPLEEFTINTDYILLEPSVILYTNLLEFVTLEYRQSLGFDVLHSAEIVRFYGSEVDRYDLSQFSRDKPQTIEFLFHSNTSLAMKPETLVSTCKDFGYFLDIEYGKAWCILQQDQFPKDKLKTRKNIPAYPFPSL